MTGPRRPLAVLFLIGLVLATIGTPAAAVGGQLEATTDEESQLQPVTTAPNTTRSLSLSAVDRSDRERATVSVTHALQAETGALEAALDEQSVETALRTSSTDDRASLRAAVNRTEARVDALAARERSARDRYREGEIGTADYLAALGAVNSEARALEGHLERLEELAEPHPSLQDRVTALQTRTVRYVGPIADGVGSAVLGGEPTSRIHVAVDGSGFALSTLQDGTFTREVMRTDARDGAVGGVDLDAAQERIAELYPWAWANKGDVSINTVGEDVFRFQLSHGHGELESLLDTSAGAVYREVQTKSLSNLPVAAGPTTTVRNRTLSVSEPRPGWPVQLQVVNATGAPVAATVSVDGDRLGETGTGPRWYLSPAEPFNVTAEADGRTIELTVTPDRS
jgi:hypothetical protein